MPETPRRPGRTFTCKSCGREFSLNEATLARFPGWQPSRCLSCRDGASPAKETPAAPRPAAAAPGRASSREQDLTLAQVLSRYGAGPKDGVFTDGAADPNPGPGGWGAVYVVGDRVVAEVCGHEPATTNNRMELIALREGCRLVPPGTRAVLYTDSQLCVNTFTKWARGWEARGWRRKDGEIKNLDLVKELYAVLKGRPELELCWIAAHSGLRWNEYADALATAYRRKVR